MSRVSTTADSAAVFAANLPESADELRAVVRAERTQLKHSLDELGSVVRHKINVRSRLLEHPIVTMGSALTAGVVLGVLSNKAGRRRIPKEGGIAGAERRDEPTRTSSWSAFGHMATTIATLVGQRLAAVAEDTVRDALTHRRASGHTGT